MSIYSNLPAISNEEISFDVEFPSYNDEKVETYPNLEAYFDNRRFRERLSRIVLYSGIAHKGCVTYYGMTAKDSRKFRAWENFCDCKPIINIMEGENRLTFEKLIDEDGDWNSGSQKSFTQVIGVGVSLTIASKIFSIPYAQWKQLGDEPFDYLGVHKCGTRVLLEARGRFNRGTNWSSAKAEVRKKMKEYEKTGYNYMIGIGYSPKTMDEMTRGLSDIFIIDPEGEGIVRDDHELERTIVSHYEPFFRIQGGRYETIADRLLEIANFPKDEFENYLNSEEGDPILAKIPLYTPVKMWGRSVLNLNGEKFFGTDWKASEMPLFPWIPNTGVYFWGIWEDIIKALQYGNFENLILHPPKFHTAILQNKQMDIIIEDGTAIFWRENEVDVR